MEKINKLKEYLSDILHVNLMANIPDNYDWQSSYMASTLINSLIRFQVYTPLKNSL